MGALPRVLGQINSRLRDISTSQRIALLLGGALVAISLIWLTQWAASPELVPLLEQDLAPDELAQVSAGVAALGEKVEVRSNRVFVPASANRQLLIAQLQQGERLPVNTSTAFANLVKETNPWISGEEAERRWTCALQQALEQVLRQFNGVKSANVFLNLNAKKGFSRTPPPSSASVTLVMKHNDAVPRSLALAAARLVAGAVAGLPPHNVQVLDAGGKVALSWDEEDDAGTQLERRLAKEEQRYATNIRQQIPDPRALISVQVELNSTASNTQSDEPTNPVSVSDRSMTEKTARGRQSEEPGVTPNVAVRAGGGALLETTDRETIESESVVGRKTRSETTPAGDVKQVTAAISLSYSYLAGVFKRLNPADAEPTEQQVEQTFQQERARLLPQLVQLVRPQAEQNVAISRYYDVVEMPPATATAATGRMDEFVGLARRHGPQAGLALLALVSLALMFRTAKRSDVSEAFGLELGLPEEAIQAAKTAAADMSALVGRQAAAGPSRAAAAPNTGPGATAMPSEVEFASPVEQAAVTEGLLVAQEVDPGTVQTRKMLEQVAQMVNGDAEGMAALVEQWLQRSDQFRDET